VALPLISEQTTQQPAIEEPIAEDPLGPQQTNSQAIVPEQQVEGRAEPSTGAPSAKPAEGNTSALRVIDQTKEQQPEVGAQSMFVDATAHGKAIVIAEVAKAKPAPRSKEESEEDEVEEVLGRPQDKRQHVYVSCWRNDQWVVLEEIPEVEETKKVERAVKRLVTEVQISFASPPDLAV